jgi:beta-lactam-binding protein with PASTA domain
VDDFTQASVHSLAQNATTVFKGCTVPNVTGKSLAAAKTAIRHAHCTVGKISHASSTNVAAGGVISSKPKAKTHVDYHAKVSLVVSTGK